MVKNQNANIPGKVVPNFQNTTLEFLVFPEVATSADEELSELAACSAFFSRGNEAPSWAFSSTQ